MLRLTSARPHCVLTLIVVRLTPTETDPKLRRAALLNRLTSTVTLQGVLSLGKELADLDPMAEDMAQVRAALFSSLARQRRVVVSTARDEKLAKVIPRLVSTEQERAHAREMLLALIADQPDSFMCTELAEAAVSLAATEEDRTRVRRALLSVLASQSSSSRIAALAELIANMNPRPEERAQAQAILFRELVSVTFVHAIQKLAQTITRFAVTKQERAQARAALLGRLTRETDSHAIKDLSYAMAQLAHRQRT